MSDDILYVVVTDDSSMLVGLHILEPEDTYQSVTGAHGNIAFVTKDFKEAEDRYKWYYACGYMRDGGIAVTISDTPVGSQEAP